ncbi:hypothetical protein CLAIMM_05266, partial [Cladophialophora immunda]
MGGRLAKLANRFAQMPAASSKQQQVAAAKPGPAERLTASRYQGVVGVRTRSEGEPFPSPSIAALAHAKAQMQSQDADARTSPPAPTRPTRGAAQGLATAVPSTYEYSVHLGDRALNHQRHMVFPPLRIVRASFLHGLSCAALVSVADVVLGEIIATGLLRPTESGQSRVKCRCKSTVRERIKAAHVPLLEKKPPTLPPTELAVLVPFLVFAYVWFRHGP